MQSTLLLLLLIFVAYSIHLKVASLLWTVGANMARYDQKRISFHSTFSQSDSVLVFRKQLQKVKEVFVTENCGKTRNVVSFDRLCSFRPNILPEGLKV